MLRARVRLLGIIATSALGVTLAQCSGPGGTWVSSVDPSQGDSQAGNSQALASSGCAATSNSSNFNGTSIPSGATIWFSSVMHLDSIASPITIGMTNSVITLTSGIHTYTIGTPNAQISVDPSVTTPSLNFAGGQWVGDYPTNTSGNDLLGAIEWPVPAAGLPGGANPVRWSAVFSSASPGFKFNWQWGAAAYTTFSPDYNALGVKPLDDNHFAPLNSDHAGTPESYKSYVIGGATGGGGASYTGGLGGTVGVVTCATPSPTPTAGGSITLR